MKDKKIIITSLVLAVAIGGVYFFTSKNSFGQEEALKIKVEKFINEKMVEPGTNVIVDKLEEEGSVYKIFATVGSQQVSAYMSKDAKMFFPAAVSMEEATEQPKTNQASNVKSDKPVVELFVMSYCPYGLQAEKGILPALELLGSKIDFRLKFVDYAMHGDKEIDENLRQYCVQKTAPEKLLGYLNCFVLSGDANACLATAKIDFSSLDTCTKETDKQFSIKDLAADNSKWETSYPPFNVDKEAITKYGVTGSPVLAINGSVVRSGRDSKSLLTAICSSFNEQPQECQQEISSLSPSAGFGSGSGSDTSSSCGN